MNESQINAFNFDFSLSFTNNFVQNEIREGKREYDPHKKLTLGGDFTGLEVSHELNFTPYTAP